MKSVLRSLKLEIGAVEWGEGRETRKEKKIITLHTNLSQTVEILIDVSKEGWPGKIPRQ